MQSKFQLTKEKREDMTSRLKAWFLEERQEELGDLSAILILDFFVENLATEFYNQGVLDSYRFMTRMTDDLLGIQK
jgi:uncharacterized protein (DUF2164 family)